MLLLYVSDKLIPNQGSQFQGCYNAPSINNKCCLFLCSNIAHLKSRNLLE